jgi:biofilm PGA synthesis protein PgaD
MGKSGSGHPVISAPSDLIICHPERQSGPQHAVFRVLTVTVWAVWFYLWLPLITAVLWLVGIRWAYIQVFRGARGVSLGLILWILLSVTVVVAYWSGYNRLRYARRTRRRHAQPLSKATIGDKFGITGTALSLLMNERCLDLYFDASGQLIRVVALTAAPSIAVSQLV